MSSYPERFPRRCCHAMADCWNGGVFGWDTMTVTGKMSLKTCHDKVYEVEYCPFCGAKVVME